MDLWSERPLGGGFPLPQSAAFLDVDENTSGRQTIHPDSAAAKLVPDLHGKLCYHGN